MRRLKKLIMLTRFKQAYKKALKNELESDRVLFISDVRDVLDGNLKCIWDQLEGEDYKLQYICIDAVKHGLSAGDIHRIAEEMAKSKYVFMEDVLSFMNVVDSRPGQKFIQLWHAAGAYKKFGFSRLTNEEGKIRISSGYRKYTHATVSSEAIRENYAEAFGIDVSRVKAAGVPRTDALFDKEKAATTKAGMLEKFPALKDKKVILFAPTYRGRRPSEATYGFDHFDLEKMAADLRQMNQVGETEYILLVKWHPAMYSNGSSQEPGRIIAANSDVLMDMSEVRDINDLLLVADLMITDYSSVIFDYYILDKPIIYFVYDLEEYYNDRSFYYAFDEYVYGQVVSSQAQLMAAIEEASMGGEKREAFGRKFMSACRGQSAKAICDWVFNE